MKIYHCAHCQQLVFFENIACVNCGHALAFLSDQSAMGALEQDGEGRWWLASPGAERHEYRLCANYSGQSVCNWAVPVDYRDELCRSCLLTRVIPNLGVSGTREAWKKLEGAKRRLIYTLLSLGLPLASKAEDPDRGLSFEFLADSDPGTPVLTGHDEGVITINLAEADDTERERRRHLMHEPYRTILGHFRHEIGHYYWDRLVKDSDRIEGFRTLFGDERRDYNEALQEYYRQGAPEDWAASFVSAYSSAHPWEDWAETWAHYLHMIDTLETAVACGLSLEPKRPDEPAMTPDIAVVGARPSPFDELIGRWFPLTYVLNNLNRGMGMPDAYPFVLPTPAIEKLRFIDQVVAGAT